MFWKNVFLIHFFIGSCKCIIDPCTSYSILDYSKYRGGNCSFKHGEALCDNLILPRWYKTEHNITISTTIQNQYRCGTHHPIWLNGSLPHIGEGIVNRTACVDYGIDHCEEELSIMIKNCNGSYAYFLTRPTTCPAAYCFGDSANCPPFEPCDFYYHGKIKDLQRSPECNTRQRAANCEPLNTGWYKLLGKNGETQLPTFCPKRSSCGTDSPIWMNGSYPTTSENISKRKVCVHGLDSCCQKTYDIEVKNCTTFLVFNLTKTDSCEEGYCFDDDDSLNCTNIDGKSKATLPECYTFILSISILPMILLNIM